MPARIEEGRTTGGGGAMEYGKARQEVMEAVHQITQLGLAQGTSGNASLRVPETGDVVITPSALAYEVIEAADIAVVDKHGMLIEGRYRPSSEMPMHLSVYRHRKEVGGIVHTHSTWATALACLGEEIPAVHYLIALVGPRVPLAAYAPYGTDELGDTVVQALGTYQAVLMQNHGVLAVGRTLGDAVTVAATVEYLATVYARARSLGTPIILPDEEIARLRTRFAAYRPERLL